LRELICDTSPLQYLHQLGLLGILGDMAAKVIVPPSVVDELRTGRAAGFDVPVVESVAWIAVRCPRATSADRSIVDLGAGESQVLMLALESPDGIAVLNDRAARRAALALNVKFTGTLGLLLDAKRMGRIPAVGPLLDRLRQLGFRVSARARRLLLERAGETP
jgi:predicted nucleic acid-binding protein